MQTIQDLFAQAIAPAQQRRQERNRQQFIPEFARTRVAVIYVNEKRNYIPSYDMHLNKKVGSIGEENGFYGLLERIVIPYKEQRCYKSIIICANLTEDLRTYIDGRVSMNYNFILFKHTLNGEPKMCPMMRFNKDTGKLDVQVLKGCTPEWWNEKTTRP